MNSVQDAKLLDFMERLTLASEYGVSTRKKLEEQTRLWKERYERSNRYAIEDQERIDRLWRSNAAYRGVITKLKKRLAGDTP